MPHRAMGYPSPLPRLVLPGQEGRTRRCRAAALGWRPELERAGYVSGRVNVTSNLRYARDAITYVQKKLYRGAANQPDSTEDGKACVDYIRGSYLSANPSVKIPYVAQQAEAAGCGNCGEQAAVAFVYLNRRGINPLAYMNLSGRHRCRNSFVCRHRNRLYRRRCEWMG